VQRTDLRVLAEVVKRALHLPADFRPACTISRKAAHCRPRDFTPGDSAFLKGKSDLAEFAE
jgi:hypothetical protein